MGKIPFEWWKSRYISNIKPNFVPPFAILHVFLLSFVNSSSQKWLKVKKKTYYVSILLQKNIWSAKNGLKSFSWWLAKTYNLNLEQILLVHFQPKTVSWWDNCFWINSRWRFCDQESFWAAYFSILSNVFNLFWWQIWAFY